MSLIGSGCFTHSWGQPTAETDTEKEWVCVCVCMCVRACVCVLLVGIALIHSHCTLVEVSATEGLRDEVPNIHLKQQKEGNASPD